jgi:hypothetical protein
MDGLIHGISDKFKELGDFLGGVGNFIKDHKGPMAVDMKLLTPNGQAIMDSLIRGIDSRKDRLAGTLGDMTLGLPGAVGMAAAGGGFGGQAVTISPGAVQITIAGSVDNSTMRQLEALMDNKIRDLAAAVRRQ